MKDEENKMQSAAPEQQAQQEQQQPQQNGGYLRPSRELKTNPRRKPQHRKRRTKRNVPCG